MITQVILPIIIIGFFLWFIIYEIREFPKRVERRYQQLLDQEYGRLYRPKDWKKP